MVLLHDLGAPEAGEPWRAVVPTSWHVPDLPGHGRTPAPRHGGYDPMGPVTLARWALAGHGLVVGVGQNAHSALIVAAGGACDAVAIVDGLWGAWPEPADAVAEMYATLRAIAADEPATAPAPDSGLDARARHGYGVTVSAAFAQRFWGAVTCPVLVVETPASPTPPERRAERTSWFGGVTTMVELPERDLSAVAAAIRAWSGR